MRLYYSQVPNFEFVDQIQNNKHSKFTRTKADFCYFQKMGKHLKHLRAEKAKVKLKKTLPKGQNVTDTSFKVKKIIIAEQLPDHAGVPLTSKHQTLQVSQVPNNTYKQIYFSMCDYVKHFIVPT